MTELSLDFNKASALQAVENLREIVTKNVKSAIATFDTLSSNLQINFPSMKEQVFNYGMTEVNATIATTFQDINNITNRAETYGINITDCVVPTIKQLAGLPAFAAQKMLSCVTTEYNTVVSIINEGIQDVNDIIAKVTSIQKKFNSCGKNIGCYLTVVVKCGILVVTISTDIATVASEVTTFVTGLQARLLSCASTQIAAITLEATTLLKNLVGCVVFKMSAGRSLK